MNPWMLTVLAGLLLWNLTGFLVAIWDKHAAKAGLRRTPERMFLMFAGTLAGPGVLTAFYGVRHKTRHRALLTKIWLLTAGTAAVLIAFFVNGGLL